MSLINQMLKDLEQCSKPHPNSQTLLSGLAVAAYSTAKKNKFNYLLIPSSLLFIMISILVICQQRYPDDAPTKNSSPAMLNVPNPKAIQPTMSDFYAGAVALTGITMQTQLGTTNLRLLLSHNTLYRVMSSGKNQLIIILENTRLITNLPQIDTMNTAIKIIQMKNQEDGSLKIIFNLNSGAELSHLELNETNKLPELQIDLSYKNAIDAGASYLPLEGAAEEHLSASSIKKISLDTSINSEFEQAMHLSLQGLNNKAIIQLTRFLVKYPEYLAARKALASLLLKRGNIAKAQHIIDVGLQQEPLYPPLILLKAQILVDENKIEEALSILRTTSPPLEENTEYYALVAALYQRQNKSMSAERLYRQLVSIQPENSIWWMGLGIAYESLSKKNEALIAFSKANNTDNLSPELKGYVENRIHALL